MDLTGVDDMLLDLLCLFVSMIAKNYELFLCSMLSRNTVGLRFIVIVYFDMLHSVFDNSFDLYRSNG